MPKTAKNLFPPIVEFRNLMSAARKAQKGKRYRASTLEFNFDLERNLQALQEELTDRTYTPGPYRDFIISDSKKRLISAAPYRDRVVHHAVMNVIEPILERGFIPDSYACRKGKGTHKALERFQDFFARYRFILKCDIRKYFQSIDHEILLGQLARKIGDARTLWLLERIVRSRNFNAQAPVIYYPGDDLFTPYERDHGIPVGNLTSQYFSNVYLDGFDHWLKEDVRVGPYVRYVDDFCIFGDDKRELAAIRQEICQYLQTLRLSIHTGKSRIYTAKEGVEFLGFRHLPDRVRIRNENLRRFRRRMRGLREEYAAGKIPLDRVTASITSWNAHADHADTLSLRGRLLPSFVFTRDRERERAELEPRASWR
jgi:RNA-directed DNA polymerase